MISAGAYSKKYQTIEKEKMKELKDRERKFNKDRTILLSIQTTQRQRAMEEKKRAMAEAEEKRRTKALEDRRRSQQQATERFRSAVNKVKVSKNSTTSRKNCGMLQVPNAKLKNTRCSHQPNICSVELGEHVKYLLPSSENRNCERLARGKEVEVSHKINDCRKTPSLDDVLDQLQGTKSDFHHCESSHQCDFQEMCSNECALHSTEVKRKSASDSNLNMLIDADTLDSRTESQNGSDDSEPQFHSANKVSMYTRAEVQTTPSIVDTFSDRANSPAIPDSLNSSVVEYDIELKNSPLKSFVQKSPTVPTERKQCFEKKTEDQPYYVCADDSDASIDSLEDTNLNVSRAKYSIQDDTAEQTSNKQKVVGILKKSYSSGMPRYDNSIAQEIPFNSSTDTLEQNHNISRPQKKVRFSDQVYVNEKDGTATVMNMSDSVQFELWKTVFPKDFLIPNSAFTPKMRCSLSSNTTTFQSNSPVTKQPFLPSDINGMSPVAEPKVTRPKNHPNNVEVKDLLDDETVNEQSSTQPLDKTPTDADINSMWDQIRQCLQDEKKVSVPPRVFNFRPPTENRRALTDSYRTNNFSANSSKLYLAQNPSARKYTARKQLVYRQPNHCRLINDHSAHVNMQNVVPTIKQEQVKDKMPSTIQSSIKEPSTKSNYKATLTSLSLEEQRLMQSIERINHRLKDHLLTPDAAELRGESYYPIPPPTPPNWHRTHSPARIRPRFSEATRKVHEASHVTNFRSLNSRSQPFRKQTSHIT